MEKVPITALLHIGLFIHASGGWAIINNGRVLILSGAYRPDF
jgi:hypothetical protein